MKKPSRTDQFDFNLFIRGTGYLVNEMMWQVYRFAYYMTFKKSMKKLARDFDDDYECPINDFDFFRDIDDPFVQHVHGTLMKLFQCRQSIILKHGYNADTEYTNPAVIQEGARYTFYNLISMRSKSYKRLRLFYERALTDFVKALYSCACALTVGSYKIPLIFRKQFKLDGDEQFRLLNTDDQNVELLLELMKELRQDLSEFQMLNTPKTKAQPKLDTAK